MPKYLIAASYTGEGLQGLRKDKATARRQAITTPSRASEAGSSASTLHSVSTTFI